MATKVVIKKQQSALAKAFTSFIKRFHLLIFFVFFTACLGVVVFMINNTLSEGGENQLLNGNTGSSTLDQATLERIESLHTSENPAPAPEMPSGRVNPFAE